MGEVAQIQICSALVRCQKQSQARALRNSSHAGTEGFRTATEL